MIYKCKFIERSEKSDLIMVEPEGSKPDSAKGWIILTDVPDDSPLLFFRSEKKLHTTFLATFVVPSLPFNLEGPDETTEVMFGDKPTLLVDANEFTFPHKQLTDAQFTLYCKALKAGGLPVPMARAKPKPKK